MACYENRYPLFAAMCFGPRRTMRAGIGWSASNLACRVKPKGARFAIRATTGPGEGRMTDGFGRRDFLKGAVAGGVAVTAPTTVAEAQAQPATAPALPASAPPGYAFLNLDEAAFVEALVD